MLKLFITSLIVFGGWLFRLPVQPDTTTDVTLEKLWETDSTLTTAESVLFDPKGNALYVACINKSFEPTHTGSFIAKLSPDGKMLKEKWATGLSVTKGMGISGNKLYVTELLRLAVIDLATGKVEKRYDVPGAKFLNDITVDSKGTVYFSDSEANKIFMLQNGKVSLVSEDAQLKGPNGLLADKGMLLVGNNKDGILYKMDLKTKKMQQFTDGLSATDGIVADGQGNYFVSSWTGKVWHVAADGSKTELINSEEEKINTADIEYIPSKKLLLVPTFFNNRVMAYQVKS
jgi:sugar lactone lactonase YvrE